MKVPLARRDMIRGVELAVSDSRLANLIESNSLMDLA